MEARKERLKLARRPRSISVWNVQLCGTLASLGDPVGVPIPFMTSTVGSD